MTKLTGPELAATRWTETPADRFWKKVAQSEGCWTWTACLDTRGYGLFWFNRRFTRAHRFSYEVTVGPIPDGLEIDHLCRNKSCVRPDHLEPVTHLENMRRSDAKSRRWGGWYNANKTHCPKGHPYSAENTMRNGRGGRSCRECHRLSDARRRAAA